MINKQMDGDFSYILLNGNNVKNQDFSLVQLISNRAITKKYDNGYRKLFEQVVLDYLREDVFIENEKSTCLLDILFYINSNPYLRLNINLVLFFLAQTSLHIPIVIITDIISRIDQRMVIAEKKLGGRQSVVLEPDMIKVTKKFDIVTIQNSGEPVITLDIDVIMEVDLALDETFLYINSAKVK